VILASVNELVGAEIKATGSISPLQVGSIVVEVVKHHKARLRSQAETRMRLQHSVSRLDNATQSE